MSWDVYLIGEDGKTVEVPRHAEGGTYVVGGVTEACLNVTYNYGEVYRLACGHNVMDCLNGGTAERSIPFLEDMVAKLGTRQFENYWAPTMGNAGHALSILLDWARLHPNATWKVT